MEKGFDRLGEGLAVLDEPLAQKPSNGEIMKWRNPKVEKPSSQKSLSGETLKWRKPKVENP